MDPARVVEFLLLSRTSPAASSTACAKPSVTLLAARPPATRSPVPSASSVASASELEFCDVAELLAGGLHGHLDRVQNGVREGSEAIGSQYFRNLQVDLHSIGSEPRRRGG